MGKFLSALELGAVGLLLAATSLPALASETPISVPEPGTLGIFTIGIGGAYLVSKYLRRK